MSVTCRRCGGELVRTHRSALEHIIVSVLPFVHPYRCRSCGLRRLGLERAPSRVAILILLVAVGMALLVAQLVWLLRGAAKDYRDERYRPRDMERYKLERQNEERP